MVARNRNFNFDKSQNGRRSAIESIMDGREFAGMQIGLLRPAFEQVHSSDTAGAFAGAVQIKEMKMELKQVEIQAACLRGLQLCKRKAAD